MEEAARVRRAALEAVETVEPDRLRRRIEARLDDGSMAPGVLTVLSAGAVEEGATDEAVARRAAGVQLIYEGLRLTRSLAHREPWTASERRESADGGTPRSALSPGADAPGRARPVGRESAREADLGILVADILVARGFYLLARTEAAETAVSTVREFGRDQTVGHRTGEDLDRNLEEDVFELAIVAGTTAAGGPVPPRLREFAAELARGEEELPGAAAVFPESVRETLAGLAVADAPAEEGIRTSADY